MRKNKGSSLSRNESAFYAQVREVIVEARRYVHKTANAAMVKAYWLVGKMIVEQQGGSAKATYGDGLIDALAEKLTVEFGAGFTRSNLRNMRQFYLCFENCHTLCGELSWSHYRLLITVENEEARRYYAEECRKSLWSVRELRATIRPSALFSARTRERILSAIPCRSTRSGSLPRNTSSSCRPRNSSLPNSAASKRPLKRRHWVGR